MFVLDSKLEADTFLVADLKISQLLLINDSNYLWLILVPRKDGLVELIDLAFDDQVEVLREINLISGILQKEFACEKLNIGAIGNMVKQLHIHVISRKKNDITFPKPVWGNAPAKPYKSEEAERLIQQIKTFL